MRTGMIHQEIYQGHRLLPVFGIWCQVMNILLSRVRQSHPARGQATPVASEPLHLEVNRHRSLSSKKHLRHLVFRNTLLMGLAAFPLFPQFNLSKEDLDSFYLALWTGVAGGLHPLRPRCSTENAMPGVRCMSKCIQT